MNIRTIIHGGRLIDPRHQIDGEQDLAIDQRGRVAAVGTHLATAHPDAQVIDATGQWVLPGLIDLSTRLREPGHEHKGTIRSETRAAVAGGVTTLCAQPDTQPVIDDPSVAELILRRNRDAGFARVIPLAALTQRLRGEQLTEVGLLREAGCVAVSDGGKPVRNRMVLRRALDYASTFDAPVFLTPLDEDLAGGGCAHEGMVATRLGLNGVPEAAETSALGSYLALVEQTGAKTHICRISARRSLRALRTARSEGLPMSADVAIHQLYLSEMDIADFDSACHVRPPLRTHEDRQGLRDALRDGLFAAITSDHQPHDPDAKLDPFPSTQPGIAGLQTLLPLVVRLAEEHVLPLSDAIALVTCGPADILGLDRGHLGEGADADLCLFDPRRTWIPRQSDWYSAGRNSPFMDWQLAGQVTRTLVRGKTVFDIGDD